MFLYIQKSSVVASNGAVRTATRTLSGADLALQDTGALVAAEYGRLAVWEHFPLFQGWAPPLSQLDGAPVLALHLDR